MSLRRLGKLADNKTRPLKIVFSDKDTKFKFLNKRKDIADNCEIKKVFDKPVYVNCDNSFLVQKEEFRLRQMLKDAKAKNPGSSCYIRSRSLYLKGTVVDEIDVRNQLF